MKPGSAIPPRPRQSVAQDLRDSLLDFVWRNFYLGTQDADICWTQDYKRLLAWVILWPAGWFIKRGVSVPGDRYKQILTGILLDALRHGNTSKVKYRPAWLKYVVQSHFAIHGEEYYAESKSARNLAEHILLVSGAASRASGILPPDPVRELAAAASLLTHKKSPSAGKKPRGQTAANLEFKL